MWFSPIIPRTGEAIFEANRVFSAAAQGTGHAAVPDLFDCRPASGNARSSSSWRHRSRPTRRPIARYLAGFKKLIEIGGQHGWGEYRTAPVFQKSVMDVYSFNNHALHRFHETLKDAIDPNGILVAGAL